MYSVIIVDDEEILREGLVNLVDWKTMGFEVAGQFEDGQDAVEFLKRCPVDVVLTDVKMTYMSGLDLSEYIVERRLPTKIVLISGYKEFDDAYRAVQLNITEFLLKPVSLDDIRQVFSRVRRLLDEERERSQKQQKLAQKLDRLVAYTTKQFVTNLALGGYRTEEEIARSLETLGLPLAGRRCAMVSIVLEGFHLFNQNEWEYGEDALYTAVCNFLQLDAEALSFYPSYGIDGRIQALAVYHLEGDEAEFLETFRRQGEKIAADIREMLGLQTRFEIERQYEDIRGFAARSQPKAGGQGAGTDTRQADEMIRDAKRQQLLITHINYGNVQAMENLFFQMQELTADADLSYVQDACINLLALVVNRLGEYDIVTYQEVKELASYVRIASSKTAEEAFRQTLQMLRAITVYMGQRSDAAQGDIIEKAKQYINDNYNKDITLFSVADYIFLSPAYFSRLFKEKVGENFKDYLVRIKLEHATRLLQSGHYKIFEISQIVGYKSTKYFYRLFKSYYGCTPNEFRQNWQMKGEVDDGGRK